MRSINRITIAFVVLLALSFGLAGTYCIREYLLADEREMNGRILQEELKQADAITDDATAVKAYKKLTPALPEIRLRIVQRQWRLALELLQYMQRARENRELRNDLVFYETRLKALLDEMVEQCGSALGDASSLRPEVEWQLHNTAGAAKVMNALVMLVSDQGADKVQGVMRDALTDFKSAIDAVDRSGAPPALKNIPRWNFEVLNGEETVRKSEVAITDSEKNQELEENLETIIPEIGGYAPGEPLETRVKK